MGTKRNLGFRRRAYQLNVGRAIAISLALCLCHIGSDGACQTTSKVSSYRAVRSEVHAFLGNGKGSYLWPDRLLTEQVDAAMGFSSGIKMLSYERTLLTGYRAHSADEEAAVLIDSNGRVLAVGLISAHCRISSPAEHATSGPIHCDIGRLGLTLFVKDAGPDGSLISPFLDWAGGRVVPASFEIRVVG